MNSPKYMTSCVARFLEYVKTDTQSREDSETFPSTPGQLDLLRRLSNELSALGLEDVSTYPALFAELARRGWTEDELRKLASENVLRVWREAEAEAERLRAERPPSTATIEGLDGPQG